MGNHQFQVSADITGEQLENIINAIGMRDQMLRQLVLGASDDELVLLFRERQDLDKASRKEEILKYYQTELIKLFDENDLDDLEALELYLPSR
jgi:parvulin-like peptidyl-prolyl isomerase